MRHRNESSLFLAAAVAASFLLLSCGGSSPTSPGPPATTGRLVFDDSGCACSPRPYPPIDIYVDGMLAGELPVFGKLTLTLPPGAHRWSIDSADGPSTSVLIQAGGTISEHLFTNLNCTDGCGDDARSAAASSTARPVPLPSASPGL
ncbi:MAG TPA: hypothetical protein VGS07_34520 [Thermoanaerobaculia bacterium]|nr:hypothetical protein [Thermoanaerobaculia bacterium]